MFSVLEYSSNALRWGTPSFLSFTQAPWCQSHFFLNMACMYMHLLSYIYAIYISSGLKASVPALFQHLMLTGTHFQTSQTEQRYKARKGSLVVDCGKANNPPVQRLDLLS